MVQSNDKKAENIFPEKLQCCLFSYSIRGGANAQFQWSCNIFLTYTMVGTWSPGPLEITILFLAHVLGDDLKKTSQPQLSCPQARGNVRIRFVCLWYLDLSPVLFVKLQIGGWTNPNLTNKQIWISHCPWLAGRKAGAVKFFSSHHPKHELGK